ncbi:acetyl-CoA carboxylase [Pseudomonas syringae]|uniref:Acetyl-CoA carboxylase n=1 Tax=Pseudomonas syringae TaxID=317 RepID=A0A1C7Z1Y4_PSESX|nr:DUF5064 family protein [Pseudomonas syringae]OCR23160.1 acetyl-CoA carboxylase [Pseudomonas syringae]
MFEPGHLHITRTALQASDFGYNIHIRYEVCECPGEGTCMRFVMEGEVAGNQFQDEFVLPRDLAFNFAHDANRIAIKHGLPHLATLPLAMHKEYDQMFEDVRHKLHAESGDTVKPEHLT